MVEGTGLENRQGGNFFVGSNPTPSAMKRTIVGIICRVCGCFALSILFRIGYIKSRMFHVKHFITYCRDYYDNSLKLIL